MLINLLLILLCCLDKLINNDCHDDTTRIGIHHLSSIINHTLTSHKIFYCCEEATCDSPPILFGTYRLPQKPHKYHKFRVD